VPIGTRIEFTEKFSDAVAKGNLASRSQSERDWIVYLECVGGFYLSNIKPGTLFVIEEATP